jgi:hypothetical protein
MRTDSQDTARTDDDRLEDQEHRHEVDADRPADDPSDQTERDQTERDQTWYDRAYGREHPDSMTGQLPATGPTPHQPPEPAVDADPVAEPIAVPIAEPAAVPIDGHADQPAGGMPSAEAPGQDSAVGLSATAVWSDTRTAEFRDRWREAQLLFVDDPRAATTNAQHLVTSAIETLTEALNEHRRSLDAWESGDSDTERLRQAMRQYRVFFDHVLGI